MWVGELYLELHRGTYTSQAATKLGNRRAEFALRDAELWCSLAPAHDYPGTEIEELWKLLLLHQFHDIIPGSGIHWVYDDTARDHAHILREAERLVDDGPRPPRRRHRHERDDVTRRRLQLALARPHGAGHGRSAGATSPGRCRPSGARGPVQRDRRGPGHLRGHRAGVRVRRSTTSSPGARPKSGAESAPVAGLSRTSICASSSTTTACCRRSSTSPRGRQVLAPGERGNRFQLHPDYPNFFDAWDIDRFAFDQVVDLDEVESIDVVEHGPLRAGIRVARSVRAARA